MSKACEWLRGTPTSATSENEIAAKSANFSRQSGLRPSRSIFFLYARVRARRNEIFRKRSYSPGTVRSNPNGISYHSGKRKEQRAVTWRRQVGKPPLPDGVSA